MSRPEAPDKLVESITETVRSSRPRRAVFAPSRVFALALTLVTLVVLASFGGISYAASALEGATKAVTRVVSPAPPVNAIRTPAQVQYGTPACHPGYMRVHGKCVRKGRISSAKLSARHFASWQARQVKLNCKFSPKSRHFAYLLIVKRGTKWIVVKSKNVSKASSFKTYTATVKQLFAGKSVKRGTYRLKLSADGNSKTVSFTVF